MKSILLLCDIFPPAFGPRMGYLCKYLKRNGLKPVVVAENIDDNRFEFLSKDIEITYIKFYNFKGIIGKFEWFCIFLLDLLFNYKEKKFFKETMKVAANHHFDVVLCSSYRTFPLLAASMTARSLNLPLVADLRDIFEQYSGNEYISHNLPHFFGLNKIISSVFRRKSLKIRNKVLKTASCVTTVSPWHVDILKKYNANTHLIYNGFDPEMFFPVDTPTDKFYITYTGRILSLRMRNPELLFTAVSQLDTEKCISPELFRIQWFTDKQSVTLIQSLLDKYPEIRKYNDFLGYIPASAIPQALNESSVILLLTNKAEENGPQGVMTTKIFEALAVQKPILCVRSDEGCLEELINRTQSGVSAQDAEETYKFVKMQFLHWKTKNQSIKTHKINEINKYSREFQASQFIDIIENL